MTNLITLTDAAINHIQSMLDKNPRALGFRLAIKKTGCSGYAYLPEVIETVKTQDIYFVAQNNLPVYIDPECADIVKGLIIDFISEKNEGLTQKRLVFINPNEKDRCGCGESFTL